MARVPLCARKINARRGKFDEGRDEGGIAAPQGSLVEADEETSVLHEGQPRGDNKYYMYRVTG